MDELSADNLTLEEEAQSRWRKIIGLVVFALMLAAFFWLLYNVLTSSQQRAKAPSGSNGQPLVAKPAPSPTVTLPPSNSGVHRRSGASGDNVVSTSKSQINVFNTYNYYSYNSPNSPTPTPSPNNPSVLGESVASANFSIIQSMLGGSGNTPGYDSSSNYQDGGSTAGDIAVGRSSSANYRTQSGYNTDPDPRLDFVVDTSTVALGNLDTTITRTGTATFNVLAYNASGYAVSIVGTSLYNGGHYITNLATDTASSTGTEQFGVNAVANTSPLVGANPAQSPSSSFSYGVAGDGATSAYATPNLFRYNSGETIASSARDSGVTDYTLSLIANISNSTPGGNYSTEIQLIATGTF